MVTIGLTGGIASGKTTVTEIMDRHGIKVIQADMIARNVMSRGGEVFEDIVARFGEDILGVDGEIDRQRLAAVVFADENERHLLNNLIHPKVIDVINREIAGLNGTDGLFVVEAPLLIEADMVGLFDKIVVVAATPELQLDRLLAKGFSEEEALSRIRAQFSNAERYGYADYIILNKGSLINLEVRVEKLINNLAKV